MLTRSWSGCDPGALARAAPRLVGPQGGALLDSGGGGRWSVSGLASAALEIRDGRAWLEPDGLDLGPAGAALARLMPRRDPRRLRRGPPFLGGWLGFLGYGAGALFDRIPEDPIRPDEPPQARLMWIDAAVCLDHATGTMHVASAGRGRPGDDPDPAHARRRVAELVELLRTPGPAPRPPARVRGPALPDPKTFLAGVGRAKEAIARGEVYQVNLAQRFELGPVADPLAVYAHLRDVNPAPYAGWLAAPATARSPAFHLVSCSPELLVETRGDLAITCPIAGTFPRGATPAEDAELLEQLRTHPKERAEHVMLVDLERNDLGRVARTGTVAVPELLGTRTLATVHHLVSTVIARLRPEVAPLDVLAAVFPGGTITGCPKLSAAALIRALEPVARGPYTGALGFVDGHGDMAFNILIRTLVACGDRAWIHGGAGVVWDSIPEREWRECVQKVKAFLALLGIDTLGLDLAGYPRPGG